jgi:hypothetical protein
VYVSVVGEREDDHVQAADVSLRLERERAPASYMASLLEPPGLNRESTWGTRRAFYPADVGRPPAAQAP